MADREVQRRLAAILAADVAGYTRLMEEDTDGTVAAWQDAREDVIKPKVSNHSGKIVKLTGDGFLVEFPTVQDAVNCAIAMQSDLASSNLEFRIGVTMGDIVDDGEDIHGEGVNVAARLEGLAEPGGIVISGDVYNQVRNRIEAKYEDMGTQKVKNVSAPIQAYAIRFESEEPIPTLSQLPDKPSIAVLPFDNMSGDPEQEYFSDGITEDIITGLSRFHWFFVIARNSSFIYKGQPVDVKQVGQELGVRYVLEGSVRKSNERVRITAQLIDAPTGHHVWAERYDRKLEDIFDLQDDISEAITTAVAPAFISAEYKRAERKAPENLDAWDYALRGNWFLWRWGKKDIAEAQRLFDLALNIDPRNSTALSGKAFALCWVNNFGWEEDLVAVRQAAYEAAKLAVDYDENDAFAHAILCFIRFYRSELDAAVATGRRALEHNPNLALAQSTLSIAYSWRGDYDQAVEHAKMAQRLSPRDPIQSMSSFARTGAEFGAGNYEESIKWAKVTTEAMPEFPAAWRYYASSLGQLGRLDEAREAKDKLLAVMPHDNLKLVWAGLPSVRLERMERFAEGLRLAGLPEG